MCIKAGILVDISYITTFYLPYVGGSRTAVNILSSSMLSQTFEISKLLFIQDYNSHVAYSFEVAKSGLVNTLEA